jgi:hypothetical protein
LSEKGLTAEGRSCIAAMKARRVNAHTPSSRRRPDPPDPSRSLRDPGPRMGVRDQGRSMRERSLRRILFTQISNDSPPILWCFLAWQGPVSIPSSPWLVAQNPLEDGIHQDGSQRGREAGNGGQPEGEGVRAKEEGGHLIRPGRAGAAEPRPSRAGALYVSKSRR